MKKSSYVVAVIALIILIASVVPLRAQENLETASPPESIHFTEIPNIERKRDSALDINVDATILAVGDVDELSFYDLKSLTLLHQLEISPADIQVLAWSPDSTKIAAYLGPANGIAIFDVQTQETLMVLNTDDNFQAHAHALLWSPDGSKLAITGTLAWRVWDTRSGTLLVDLTPLVAWPESISLFDDGLVHLLAWSPDNNQLALPDGENISIFDVSTWEKEKTLATDIYRITSLDWSSDGQLAVSGQIGSIQVWNVISEHLLYAIPIEGDHFVVQWSDNGEMLAVSGSSEIYLIAAQEQTIVQILQGHSTTVYDFDWKSGDDLIISREHAGNILVWDL